jgi:ADP-ribose pyrophosphatase/8-oxo-dGTP diphosphatase
MDLTQSRPIVSAIIEKEENNTKYIFLQTRWKPKTSPDYSGLLEIPAGGIEGYEDVIDAIKREVKEETGLDIIQIKGNYEEKIEENIKGNKVKIFKPFLCQQMLSSTGGLPWVGFVFRCEVQGTVTIDLSEAKDPIWVTISELKELLSNSPEKFFPLQYPVLKYYVENL